uniref:Charged multivesicular body protein 2a n=1 Tax=Macrostomum lignano TaxID=282301 RepID=A0A1I8GT85_9PLAT
MPFSLFGRKKTPEEMLRQNQRALNRAMRDLDRERGRLEQQEKKVIADMKKLAKQGQMDAVKIMAKDLVRTRSYIKKFIMMRANIQAISLKIQTLRSTNQMAQAMKGVTLTMQRMNQSMNLPQLQQIMAQFEKESEMMDMKEEVMSDAIDDAIGNTDDEEASDAVVTKVLDELGIEMTGQLAGIGPGSSTIGEASSAPAKSGAKKPSARLPLPEAQLAAAAAAAAVAVAAVAAAEVAAVAAVAVEPI